MDLKIISLVSSVSTCVLMMQSPISFEYRYEIIANSYHPFDQACIYEYKEKLIDVYEELCFTHLEREYQDIIINNIHLFEFDDSIVASYYNGAIVLVVGNGTGNTYKGKLKRNSCDESAIREKFFYIWTF